MFWWIGVYGTFLWAYNAFLESLLGIVWGTVRSYVLQEKLPKRYGPWAVITGSTDGIGRCYADELAAKGFKIMLISRSEPKLVRVASEIEQKYGVETKWIAVDFSKGPEIYDQLRDQLAAIEIGMLVNNVGFLPNLNTFDRNSETDLLALININMVSMTMLTRMVLPQMKLRRKGIVVNIGSSSGYDPTPFMAAYAASKAYVFSFSAAVNYELKGSGVECQVVTPSIIHTNMGSTYDGEMAWYVMVLNPVQMARFAVYTIGKTSKTFGHWLHTMESCYMSALPGALVTRMKAMVLEPGISKPAPTGNVPQKLE